MLHICMLVRIRVCGWVVRGSARCFFIHNSTASCALGVCGGRGDQQDVHFYSKTIVSCGFERECGGWIVFWRNL